MKKMIIFVFFILICVHAAAALGDEEAFLEAPLPSTGETLKKTDTRLEMKVNMSHDETVSFYRQALQNEKDIKFRHWKDATYIEDDGNRPWHSITISKMDQGGAPVIIVKDNWTWIIGTLILRYIGVFVVLIILFIGMSISGAVISRSVKRIEEGKKKK